MSSWSKKLISLLHKICSLTPRVSVFLKKAVIKTAPAVLVLAEIEFQRLTVSHLLQRQTALVVGSASKIPATNLR